MSRGEKKEIEVGLSDREKGNKRETELMGQRRTGKKIDKGRETEGERG